MAKTTSMSNGEVEMEELQDVDDYDTDLAKPNVVVDNIGKDATAPSRGLGSRDWMSNIWRFVAQYPWVILGINLAVVIFLAVVGMHFGKFSVEADNAGWQSRGTLISDRHAQLLLVTEYEVELRVSDATWDDLIDNVQPGWESFDDDDNESNRRLLQEHDDLPQASWSEWGMFPPRARRVRKEQQHDYEGYSKAKEQMKMLQRRFLDEDQPPLDLPNCDLAWYESDAPYDGENLWPVWKVESADDSALDPDVLRELCEAEEQTMQVLKREKLCGGCNDDECLPPLSIVLFARAQVGDRDVSLSCADLASSWAEYQSGVQDIWAPCAEQMFKGSYRLGQAETLPDVCPRYFTPSFVDGGFSTTNKKVAYTSSIFYTDNADIEDLFDVVADFDRAGGLIRGAYDTRFEDFVNLQVDTALGQDMLLACASAIITGIAILVHTRSPFVTCIGLLQIILSFPLSYFVYYFIGQVRFFPFLNFIGIFVVFALGADDIFVAVDKWKNARLEHPTATTADVAAMAFPDAAGAMFLTTLTTAVAFLGTAICPVAPIKAFAVFVGLLVLFDYFLCVLLVFPALAIYDRLKKHPVIGCCFSCACCGLCGARTAGAADTETAPPDEETAAEEDSPIRRILKAYYWGFHKFRWPLLVLSLVAFILSALWASRLELPTSSDVRLLDASKSQYEQNFEWRKELLYDVLEARAGSTAYIIWGVTAADTGTLIDPNSFTQLVLDDSFDPSSTEAQTYLLGFCDDLFAQEWAQETDESYKCPMNRFQEWLAKQAVDPTPSTTYLDYCLDDSVQVVTSAGGDVNFTAGTPTNGLPMDPTLFHKCFSQWAENVASDGTVYAKDDGIVRIMYISFTSRVRFDSPFDDLDKEWHMIEDWMEVQRTQEAPPGVNQMYHTSEDFWWYDTNGKMLVTAQGSAAIAIGMAAFVILLSSRSLVLTIFAAFTIAYVLASVTACLVALGWSLGFLESICFAILIGISSDFVVHFSHAYATMAGEVDRGERTRFALIHMGPSILAAAFTTICAATIMLFTVISFFQKFAVILFMTILQATVGSFVVFLVLTDTIGPTHPTFLYDLVVRQIRGRENDAVEAQKEKEEDKTGNGNVA